jgi:hypothetical protein
MASYSTQAFSMASPIRGTIERGFLRVAMYFARKYREYAPLKRIGTIHMAAFCFIPALADRYGVPHLLPREFLLFVSLFDGAADQYLNDFGTVVPDEIDSIWGKCVRYPGARNTQPFVHWLEGHQLSDKSGTVDSYSYFGYGIEDEEASAVGRAPSPTRDGMATVPLVLNAIDLRRRLQRLRELLVGEQDNAVAISEMNEVVAATPLGKSL